MESHKPKSAFHSTTAHLTHSCFRCSERFSNSGLLVQHIKENHTSFVEHPPSSNMPRPSDMADRDSSPYRNAIATCPYCGHDCLTRKKLMLHLELEHKDVNDSEEEPRLKYIRLNSSPQASSDSNVVRNLLQTIGPQNTNVASTSIAKTESKPSNNRLQYKCFWCEASFRKRGKLMDHIDTLHKHNKQQNQVEAEMLSLDDPTRQLNRLPPSTFSSNMFRPPSLAGYHHSSGSTSAQSTSSVSSISTTHQNSFISTVSRADNPVTETKNKQSSNLCSFNLLGSLKPTDKPKNVETTPVNLCKFYLGKKGNPIANTRLTPTMKTAVNFHPGSSTAANSNRRYSLPNMLEGASNGIAALSNYPYHYRLMSPANTMAAAMQQSYLFGMRPPMFPQSFYQPSSMPMMLPPTPCTTALADRSQTSPRQQTAQFLNRMNTLNHNIRSSGTAHSDSPLDLTKSYL